MDRNVCRCGTYPRIVQAVKLAAERHVDVERRSVAMSRPAVAASTRQAASRRAIEVERYELTRRRRTGSSCSGATSCSVFAAMGGGLAVLASLPTAAAQQESGRGGAGRRPERFSAWLHVDENGRVTAFTGKTEIGQNISTSLAQAVADELRVPLDGRVAW